MQRSNASSLEPTSKHFVAKLGTLNPAVEERLQRWAAASCEEHVLRRRGDGPVALYAVKSSAKTARQYQSLLRTLASHWKLPFGKLDRGWLSLSWAKESTEPQSSHRAQACQGQPCQEEARPAAHAPRRRLWPRGPPARNGVQTKLCTWHPRARRLPTPES